MSSSELPFEMVVELINDLRADQQALTARLDDDFATSSIAYTYAFAALAEAAIETGGVDRSRLVAWLGAAAEHAEARVGRPAIPELLARLAEVVVAEAIDAPD